MNKKAQISSVFSYIMGIVIGGIVLIFFIGFAYQFLSFAGGLNAAETVNALNDQIAAFSVSESAEMSMSSISSLDFTMTEGKITTDGQSKQVDHIIFSPFQIKGKGSEVILATKSFELPYRITNLFYLADGKTVYVFVYDSTTEEVAKELTESYNALPKNFPSYSFSITQVSSNIDELVEITAQYDQVKFIFLTSYDEVLSDIQDSFSNYEILSVDSSIEDYSYGKIEFPDGEEEIYMGYPLLIGAIVSEDVESYQYNLDLVFEKLSIVTGVYYDKARFVSSKLPTCEYDTVKTSLGSYYSFVSEDVNSYTSFETKIEKLDDSNNALGGDCPEVY